MYNGVTGVYLDVTELSAAVMNETVIPLISPVRKTVKMVIDVWDDDFVSSSDFIAQFEGMLDMERLSRNWSTIPLSRKDLVCANNVSMKALVRVDCPGQATNGTCNIVCRPREGVNTCDADGNFICQRGFMGPTCDQIDYCITNNCADYATCQPLQDGYKCVCKGHEGSICEKGYNPCPAESPCGPHGQCSADGPEYQCVCETGWGGRFCDREATPCERAAQELGQSSVCLNGGTCRNTDDNGYYCQCPQPGTGPRCEMMDTLYFILPMAILPLLIIVVITATYRRFLRQRFREKTKPITYATRQTSDHGKDSISCEISPYAIYIPSVGENTAYRLCNDPYYMQPVRIQEGVPLNRQNSEAVTLDRRKSSGDPTPVLPPRSALRERQPRSPTDTYMYINDLNSAVK
ncbi:unnamed protein product [Taenia asiatica]|uniref:Delta-like protein n=1 Tax=Taenia asiatica TaxID=60517 RepID=A0A0R3WB43_TAEAS|nr:unnamed protein product [Taenia asiatica]